MIVAREIVEGLPAGNPWTLVLLVVVPVVVFGLLGWLWRDERRPAPPAPPRLCPGRGVLEQVLVADDRQRVVLCPACGAVLLVESPADLAPVPTHFPTNRTLEVS